MKYMDSQCFNDATITINEYRFLVDFVGQRKISKVLEFGPGVSTWSFLECGCEVSSCEYSDEWFNFAKENFKQTNVDLYLFDDKFDIVIPEIDNHIHFDMAFIDSPPMLRYKYFSRLNACEYAAKHTDLILLHDASRDMEQNTIKVLEEKGWTLNSVFPSGDFLRGIAILEYGV